MSVDSKPAELILKPLTLEGLLEANRRQMTSSRQGMRWMYSSFWGGWTKDPALMLLPLDDHGFHRGDAVFEAIKFNAGKIYLLNEHLLRLQRSADRIGLRLPWSQAELKSLLNYGVQAVLSDANSRLSQGLIRLFVTRGPGDFSPNPYSTLGSQLHVVITELSPVKEDWLKRGCRVGLSSVAVKPAPYPQIKSCNYLPNVLMKKEAVDRGLDFVVSVDSSGFLAESATENFAWLDAEGSLCFPRPLHILDGCTLTRAAKLAESLGWVVKEVNARPEDLRSARGAMMIGTTLDVTPVGEFLISDQDSDRIHWRHQSDRIFELRKKLIEDQL
ncbi:MAG TPA: aminotransferase class IV [Pseudobdellovibrionaceae bacterium]|nr:aminotransferase class IV [Pseudobdellovibrionaceae bacterium]